MLLKRPLLEDWLRDYYYDLDVDLGCSGVEDFSFGELRRLVGLLQEDLDEVVFHDSRSLGGLGIRQAVADRFARGEIERVMVTHGSTEANFLLMNTLLHPGDEVITLDPFTSSSPAWPTASAAGSCSGGSVLSMHSGRTSTSYAG
jgi:aspartate/methionine/tyrosine aminotransferase